MDDRALILVLAFAFLVVSVVYLLVAIVRARRAVVVPPMQPEAQWPMLKPAPPALEAAAREDRTFAEPTTGVAAVLNQPLRTGRWRPDSDESALPRTSTADDYWDTLVEEETLLVRPAGHDQRATGIIAQPRQSAVQVFGVVVAKGQRLGVSKLRPVVNAGVRVAIEQQIVVLAGQG